MLHYIIATILTFCFGVLVVLVGAVVVFDLGMNYEKKK
jgi:hypothetical protein